MNDNFTYHPCNFNAVAEGRTFFVTEGHNFTLLQLHINLMLYSDTKTEPLIVPVLSGFHLTKEWL